MSKRLKIPYRESGPDLTLRTMNNLVDSLTLTEIANNPWPEYRNSTKADFAIAHNGDTIFLKYVIHEKFLLAKAVHGGKIHHDSCVEWFIAFDDTGYYNMEFNALGYRKIAFGKNGKQRELLPPSSIEQVQFFTSIQSIALSEGGGFQWEILLAIPRTVFVRHELSSFSNLQAKGNFYKCGDMLPEPHFLSWNMIHTDKPDFHRKDFFGVLEFE